MTSAAIGALAPSNATKESHATFDSISVLERLAAKPVFKEASSSARKSFGAGFVAISGEGGYTISSDMLVNVFR